MNIRQFVSLLKQTVSAWIDDYAPSMGAAISYYTVFSLAPLILIVISAAGLIWGREAVQGEIVGQLSGLLGEDASRGVQGMLASVNEPAEGVISTVVGFAVLAFGATTVFAELQSAMDRIWEVPVGQKKKSGLLATLRTRLLSFGLILGLAFLLIVSLIVSAAVAAFGSWAQSSLPASEFLLQAANMTASLGVMTLLFAMLYKLLPQARVGWQDVWIGAGVTAVLLEIGKVAIGLYIGKSSLASSYAAAGSVVVVLVWVYYAAQIFLLGAEFTWVYAHSHGSRAGAVAPPPASGVVGAKALPPVAVDATTGGASPPAPVDAPRQQPARVRPSDAVASVAVAATKQGQLSLGQRAAIVGVATVLQLMVLKLLGRRRTAQPVGAPRLRTQR